MLIGQATRVGATQRRPASMGIGRRLMLLWLRIRHLSESQRTSQSFALLMHWGMTGVHAAPRMECGLAWTVEKMDANSRHIGLMVGL